MKIWALIRHIMYCANNIRWAYLFSQPCETEIVTTPIYRWRSEASRGYVMGSGPQSWGGVDQMVDSTAHVLSHLPQCRHLLNMVANRKWQYLCGLAHSCEQMLVEKLCTSSWKVCSVYQTPLAYKLPAGWDLNMFQLVWSLRAWHTVCPTLADEVNEWKLVSHLSCSFFI